VANERSQQMQLGNIAKKKFQLLGLAKKLLW
jgi:hypothetical protein